MYFEEAHQKVCQAVQLITDEINREFPRLRISMHVVFITRSIVSSICFKMRSARISDELRAGIQERYELALKDEIFDEIRIVTTESHSGGHGDPALTVVYDYPKNVNYPSP
jgi:hypothetical protein